MGAKSRYSLQRTMIIYFLLIGFASMLVGVEFLADFQGGQLKEEIWSRIQHPHQPSIDKETVLAPIDRLRSKAILMVAIIMVVVVIVLTMFIKHITEPLQHMILKAQQISAGDLSQTIRIEANNELNELGNVINEMSSNLQEIILLSQHICANGQSRVEQALAQLKQYAPDSRKLSRVENSIQALGDELTNLSEVVACFSFYSVERKSDAR